jgi:RecB family exonuclease
MTTMLGWPNSKPSLTISNSEIQCWKNCPRQWYLAYYLELGLKREDGEATGARSLGSRIHVALHMMYVEGANPITVLDEIYAEDVKFFQEAGRPETEIIDLKKEQDLAHAMIEGFLDWLSQEGIDEEYELVGAETVVQVESGIENVFLRGKLDQRWVRKSDGARLFRDFKTVGDFIRPRKLLPLDEQMKFYHLLEFLDALQRTGKGPQWATDGGLYTMLRKVKRTATAKPPFYDQVEISHNTEELRSMWLRVQKVIREIIETRLALDEGGDHRYWARPRPSDKCTWGCDFLPVCPMMDDGSNWKGLLKEYYTHIDPHERYRAQDEGREVTE